MSLDTIRKQAKEAGIPWREVIAAEREIQAVYEAQQEFIDEVRRRAFVYLTGRRDRFWMIFGHVSDKTFGKWFHGGGDYNTIENFDTAARSVFFECPGLCSREEDAAEALWDFLTSQPFRVPSNDELYKEAVNMMTASIAEVPF
jgi:hypothetical protein